VSAASATATGGATRGAIRSIRRVNEAVFEEAFGSVDALLELPVSEAGLRLFRLRLFHHQPTYALAATRRRPGNGRSSCAKPARTFVCGFSGRSKKRATSSTSGR
jgi:hypothetical protein